MNSLQDALSKTSLVTEKTRTEVAEKDKKKQEEKQAIIKEHAMVTEALEKMFKNSP